mmetsp:Transcript_1522/g.3665  ORF Transcript_1522/g.3665 Transcript_1522/m.3665 type:complete len:207 (-) Transcript_1522:126-746(-)
MAEEAQVSSVCFGHHGIGPREVMAAKRRVSAGVIATALFALAWVSSCFVGLTATKRTPAVARASDLGFEGDGSLGDGETTPLMMAAHKNDAEEVKAYVKNGANLNAQDLYGWTALRYAVRADNVEATKALLDGGADMNLPSKSGRTPLMSAASNGISDMVKMLLDAGADAKLKNSEGFTAYDMSLRGGATGCDECRQMLQQAQEVA